MLLHIRYEKANSLQQQQQNMHISAIFSQATGSNAEFTNNLAVHLIYAQRQLTAALLPDNDKPATGRSVRRLVCEQRPRTAAPLGYQTASRRWIDRQQWVRMRLSSLRFHSRKAANETQTPGSSQSSPSASDPIPTFGPLSFEWRVSDATVVQGKCQMRTARPIRPLG